MRKIVLVLLASLSLMLGMVGSASAAPSNYPENPKACIGYSSTIANAAFQNADPDKYRSEQARGMAVPGQETGEQGRKDDVQDIRDGDRCNDSVE